MATMRTLTGETVAVENFLTPYNAAVFGRLDDHCMEERPGEGRGLQIPGGVSGVIVARRLGLSAMEGKHRPDAPSVDQETKSLMELTDSKPHEACAARGFRPAILTFMVKEPDIVYKTANEIADINPTDFDRVIGAAEYMLRAELAEVGPMDESKFTPLLRGEDNKPVNHRGQHVIAIHNTSGDHVLWDNRAAWEADAPAYALNVGLYEERADRFNRSILGVGAGECVDPELFTVAGIAYAASTIHHLPKTDGEAPQVVRVPALI